MVTGAGGFLGRHISARLAEKGFKCLTFSHGQLDITDAEAVRETVFKCNPDVVVHCAAISSTSYANEHPDESMAINVIGCENLARACRGTRSGLYVMSSDQVYGGCSGCNPLPETAASVPNNIYGKHKLLMEDRVLDIFPETVVLRLTWMYETYNAECPHADIVSRILTAAADGRKMKASTREYRGISDVDDVCGNIIASFGILPGGVYNFGSANNIDSYSTLLKVSQATGLPENLFAPDDSWGRNLSMDCSRISSFGLEFSDTVSALSNRLKAYFVQNGESYII